MKKLVSISSNGSLFVLLFIISTITIIPFLGTTNYYTQEEPCEAMVTVSMLGNDNWALPVDNGGDMTYTPPFYHWCVAAFSLPGGEVTEFTTRLPSALAAIVMALACFLFFAKRGRHDVAYLSTLLLLFGFEVHRAAMTAQVDMVLTCFIVLALLQLYKWWERQLKGIPLWAILFMSIATLTQGAVGILLPCAVLGVFLLFQYVSLWRVFYKILSIALLSLILPLTGYYLAYQQGGDTSLQSALEDIVGKMRYESHEQPIIYYIYTTLVGWMPWSILVIISLFAFKYKLPQNKIANYLSRFKHSITHMDTMRLFSLLAIVIIFVFYCILKSKRSVYLLPIYPFIAYFSAEYMLYLLKHKTRVWRIFSMMLSLIAGGLVLLLILIKSKVITSDMFSGENSHYVEALSQSGGILFIVVAALVIFLIYEVYKSRRFLTFNNRYLYSVVMLFMGVQLMFDASILPTVLNTKSIKSQAEKVIETVPEEEIYTYVSTDTYGEQYTFTHTHTLRSNEVNDFYLAHEFQKNNEVSDSEK